MPKILLLLALSGCSLFTSAQRRHETGACSSSRAPVVVDAAAAVVALAAAGAQFYLAKENEGDNEIGGLWANGAVQSTGIGLALVGSATWGYRAAARCR